MTINLIDNITENYDSYIVFMYKNNITFENTLFYSEGLYLKNMAEKSGFTGKKEEVFVIPFAKGNSVVQIVLVGLGKKEKVNTEIIRKSLYKGLTTLKDVESTLIIENNPIENVEKALVETVYFANYEFNKYKTKKSEKKEINKIDIIGDLDNNKIEESKIYAEAVYITRDLVNEPANVIYPETLAEKAKEYGEKYGFEVEIFEEEKIKELKMEAFLSVAQAAEKRPKFIIMRYKGNESSETIGLVGKGLTYDTGGLSLKPTNSMDTMKSDMGGAATVIGVMSAIARLKINKNIVAVIAACENSIAGNAYRPGDIINSMAGKTIEVLNTDAEGRLTLVDAVHYVIENEKADKVIDVATLTGAALVALGTTTTAVVTNNEELYKKLEESSIETDERVWQLPNFPEYGKLLESKIADVKNIGGRFAGTITAGMFIEKFVQKKPWIHLDIAGVAYTDSPYSYYKFGATGQPVRTLINFLKKI
ncbi:MAG: leucyl aminopeptidase [Fusobacteriaceae bacterium]|jgi:leucyl aminopeptidase|nr:leucyl aminopeptidase [Fusobacteriaceae bacterium]